MRTQDVEKLRAAEAKLLAKLKPGERMLFDPEHERHPQGEDWWRKLAIFRGWLGQLREVRQGLADLGQTIQYCPVCGSTARFDGQLAGCYDCGPTDAAVDGLDRQLMTDGYAVIPTKRGIVVVVRESDTLVPEKYAGAVRYSVGELARLIGSQSGGSHAAVALKAVFPGVELAADGLDFSVSGNKGEQPPRTINGGNE